MGRVLPFDPKSPLWGFTARFPHAKRRIHLFADERFVYFRPKNAASDWWGAGWMELYLFDPPSRYEQCHFWHKQVKAHGFLRVFFLPDPRPGQTRWWQIIWRPEDGYVIPVEHPDDLDGAFFFCRAKSKISMVRASTSQLQRLFLDEWNDPTSDVRAALDWCDLTDEERSWRSVQWEYGGHEELEQVARAGCICEPEWDQGHPLRLSLSMRRRSSHNSDNGLEIYASVAAMRWRLSGESRLRRLFDRLLERNCGFYDLPIGARNDWPLAWVQRPKRSHGKWRKVASTARGAGISIEINSPTHHEHLEAALFLREWLTEHAPDLLPDWFPGAS